MTAWLDAGLKNRLAAARRFDHRKTPRIRVGFLPVLWVSGFGFGRPGLAGKILRIRVGKPPISCLSWLSPAFLAAFLSAWRRLAGLIGKLRRAVDYEREVDIVDVSRHRQREIDCIDGRAELSSMLFRADFDACDST